ncbi:unnamed protein product [Soboliphyme baturini]|uniref:Uncharacterized protein n=1 Tax=Soboliphyme baturini TaxID=241478 RepID=A0A183J094_9BILA|nr:unnamed protein product [Soboliphyme baturini]
MRSNQGEDLKLAALCQLTIDEGTCNNRQTSILKVTKNSGQMEGSNNLQLLSSNEWKHTILKSNQQTNSFETKFGVVNRNKNVHYCFWCC